MMNHKVDDFNRAKGKMSSDFSKAITDADELRKSAAEVSGAGVAVALGAIEEKLGGARARLADVSRAAAGTARKTAAAADDYVHGSPWTVIGIAAAAGLLIGLLAARR